MSKRHFSLELYESNEKYLKYMVPECGSGSGFAQICTGDIDKVTCKSCHKTLFFKSAKANERDK